MERLGTYEKIASFMQKEKQPYEFKRKYAQIRAKEFATECDGRGLNYHVSVGGLDSIILYIFLHEVCGIDVPGVSASTLEDKSIQRVHKALGIINVPPLKRDDGTYWTKAKVIQEFGFPVISKEVAAKVELLQNPSEKNKTVRHAIITGETGEYGGWQKNSKMQLNQRWLKLFGGYENETEGCDFQKPDFLVSAKCCYYLKEKNCDDWGKEHNSVPYLGLMASEGGRRALFESFGLGKTVQEIEFYETVYGDCVEETKAMESNSIDLIHTSIPFGNHYEYSANYNDFGHNQNTERFFEQMCYLTPELLRVLKPGRVAAIHVKDRVLFGNATGTGMPTIEPFHALCIEHYMKYGFQYFGMITVVTDVVRENNQTYRLGWTEQCKDGSKMGVGCPEYILLFRKLPTDRSTAYADVPVKKSKEDYTRAQWQIDAHGYWRSSGNRLVSKEELKEFPVESLQQVYRDYSRGTVYNYAEHVKLAEDLDENGKLPATFMVVAPGSWNQLEVWDDINRMRTLNTTQSRRRAQMHVCPLQLDIVERIINRYSNEGDTVYDPFGGLMTVPMTAVKMHRYGKGCELNPDYFRDGVGYLQAAENEVDEPTLFDFLKS